VTLCVLDVQADPALGFDSATAGGSAVRLKVFSGAVEVGFEGRRPVFGTMTFPEPVQLGFYVPGAGPLQASWSMQAWADLSLARVGMPAQQATFHGTFGVGGATVQLVDDPQRGRWPYVWFTAYGGEPMQVRYRVRVTEPAG